MKSSVDDNIDALSKAIMEQARSEADQMLADAKTKAEEIRKRAEQRAAEERKAILSRVSQEAERIHGQKIATAQMKARTMQLEHREKLLEKVFDEAQKELVGIQQWTEYPEIAETLLREALMQIRAEVVEVQADEKTLSLLKRGALDKVAKELNTQITVGAPLERGIGVIVKTADGHLQYDNTLETRLRRMKSSLRSPVHHLLMGEAL